MPNQQMLSIPAAARYLGIGERQLRALVDRHVIAYHDVGGRAMFLEEDLEAYLKLIRVEADAGVRHA